MNTRFYSSRQEKIVAKNLKGKKQKNSGATLFAKGDIKVGNYIIECKTSVIEKQSYTIKKKDIEKIQEEAFGMGLNKNDAILCFNFGNNKENFYIITERKLKEWLK